MDGSSQETPAISTTTSSTGGSAANSNSRRYRINLAASSFIHSPITSLLEYSGLLQAEGGNSSSSSSSLSVSVSSASPSAAAAAGGDTEELVPSASSSSSPPVDSDRELTIRIIGDSEDRISQQSTSSFSSSSTDGQPGPGGDSIVGGSSSIGAGSDDSSSSSSVTASNSSSSSYQRYDVQNFARWVEQILPFSLLLVLVFIRQHLQGFCVSLWIAVVLYKSNDVLRKQTALKGERKMSVLLGMISVFMLHVLLIYWWYRNNGLLCPLLFIPPKTIPPFWHAVFIIVVNDAMVRMVGMAFKCFLLLYYKNSRGQNYRKQGQMLTLVEYVMLVYRSLLPAPVWYRFFLNKEYGSFFSSLVTGLYLTIKLTSALSKVQLFFAALRALSRKEMHYGSYATTEQVNAAGDLCAICQEKMQAPILLRCKHIFCEDCVSEWFERERTCPLCRALVKPADIRSYSDGSTSLLFQLF